MGESYKRKECEFLSLPAAFVDFLADDAMSEFDIVCAISVTREKEIETFVMTEETPGGRGEPKTWI